MYQSLLITMDYPPNNGGVARYLKNYSDEQGLDVLAPKTNVETEGGVIRRRLIWNFWPKWLPLIFWGYFYGVRYKEIVISHILPVGYVCLLLGRPYTVILHGLDIINSGKGGWKRFWAKRILDNAESIIVNSRATGGLLQTVFGPKYEFEINYPVAPQLPKSTKDYGRELGLENKKVILSLGRLVKRKGQEMVLRLMPRILQEVPEAIFVIAGEGPHKKELLYFTKELKIGDSIRFLGKVKEEDLSNIYNMSDVFVLTALPSTDNWEGFGIVCLEADQFNKPVVVSNTGGLPEAAEQCKRGYVINNDEELLKTLIDLLKT